MTITPVLWYLKIACNNLAIKRKNYNKVIVKPIHAPVHELDEIEMKILDSCQAHLSLNLSYI
jgi:hypothetical protein